MPRCLSKKLANMTRKEYIGEIQELRRELNDLRGCAGARVEKAYVKAGEIEANLKAQVKAYDRMRSERNIFASHRYLLPGYVNCVFSPDRQLTSQISTYRSDLQYRATTPGSRSRLCLSLMQLRKKQMDKVRNYQACINRTMEHIKLSDDWSWERRKLQQDLEASRADLMAQQVHLGVPGAQAAVHEYQEKPRFTDQAMVLEHGYVHQYFNRCSMYISERDQSQKAVVNVERMVLITFPTMAAAEFWYNTHQSGCMSMAKSLFLDAYNKE
jgi:hypothetical protein